MHLTGKTLSIVGGIMLGWSLGQPAAATEVKPKPTFDWMANAAKSASNADRLKQARQAVSKSLAINTNSTWVCSPAGFGKRSRCQRG